jgi:hypothetical protein
MTEDFYIVVGKYIPEQHPSNDMAKAIEECWEFEDPTMEIYHVRPKRGAVIDVTDTVAGLMADATIEKEIDVTGWLFQFLGRFAHEYYDPDEPHQRRAASYSTLNHTQQGLAR